MDWIRRGLHFQCQPDCGRCCSNEREGRVYLEPMDVVRLAAAFGLTGGKFVLEHTETDEDGDISLRLAPDGSCIFLNEGRCTVYEARPFQCRAYPFLPTTDYSPVASSSDWRSERRLCPGIGKGRFYRKAEIEAISRDRDETAGFEV